MENNIEDMISCDNARRLWFCSRPGQASPEQIDDAISLRMEIGDETGPRGRAIQIAYLVECYTGWPMFEGVALDRNGNPLCLHAWNILPNGSVLDTSVDLHSPELPCLAELNSERMRCYRREWTQDYNPDLDKFTELAGATWSGIDDMTLITKSLDSHYPGP